MPTGEATVSVLLPVHAGVRPEHLRRALESISEQTRPPDEVVIVEDGPLVSDQVAAVEEFVTEARYPVVVLRLAENRGAGVANGEGLRVANGDWIMKADADDINLLSRLEQQLAFVENTGVDVCGSAMAEFDSDEDDVTAVRTSPLTHAQIARRMRINNPVNHPTSFYRRDSALAVGGYADLRFMQDYDLFARMLANGAHFANMPTPLVKFRADSGMYRRRTATAMNRSEWALQHRLRDCGLIGSWRMWFNLVVRLAFRRLPRPALRLAYWALVRRGG